MESKSCDEVIVGDKLGDEKKSVQDDFIEKETRRPMKITTNYSGQGARKGSKSNFQPTSPTDKLLSPCSRKLMRKSTRDSPNTNLEFWTPPATTHVILGSSSKSRALILQELEWRFTTISPNIDERAVQESYQGANIGLPEAIAKAKAEAIQDSLKERKSTKEEKDEIPSNCVIITSDQIVLFRNRILGKPKDIAEARKFLSSYQNGETCQTVTAVVATHLPSGNQSSEVDICTVHWSGIPEDSMDVLLAKEDVLYSCGGFLIEDQDFVDHVQYIEGSLDSIRGLPIKAMKKAMVNVIPDV